MNKSLNHPPLGLINVLEFVHDDVAKLTDPFPPLCSNEPLLAHFHKFINKIQLLKIFGRELVKKGAGEPVEGSYPEFRWADETFNAMSHLNRRIP
jgi:hypothetical protein